MPEETLAELMGFGWDDINPLTYVKKGATLVGKGVAAVTDPLGLGSIRKKIFSITSNPIFRMGAHGLSMATPVGFAARGSVGITGQLTDKLSLATGGGKVPSYGPAAIAESVQSISSVVRGAKRGNKKALAIVAATKKEADSGHKGAQSALSMIQAVQKGLSQLTLIVPASPEGMASVRSAAARPDFAARVVATTAQAAKGDPAALQSSAVITYTMRQ